MRRGKITGKGYDNAANNHSVASETGLGVAARDSEHSPPGSTENQGCTGVISYLSAASPLSLSVLLLCWP